MDKYTEILRIDMEALTEYELAIVRACINERKDCSPLKIPKSACNDKIKDDILTAGFSTDRAQLIITIALVMQALEGKHANTN